MKTLYSSFKNLHEVINYLNPDKILVLSDENVKKYVVPKLIKREIISQPFHPLILEAGEQSKSIGTLETIWRFLVDEHATKKTLLINIGGGMVSDIGGFAAATFKRGIPCVNISTTILGACDAACGGKTAINFRGIKNVIGSFSNPVASFFFEDSLATLPEEELLSGYGELLKTGFLISEEKLDEIYNLSLNIRTNKNLPDIIVDASNFKNKVVEEDPFDKGKRRILNFGHTAGHAFESLMLEKGRPIAHGVAVAHGILIELILSILLCKLSSNVVNRYSEVLKSHFPKIYFDCNDYSELLRFMNEDKKIEGSLFNFTLLSKVGHPLYNQEVGEAEVESAFDIYRDMMSI